MTHSQYLYLLSHDNLVKTIAEQLNDLAQVFLQFLSFSHSFIYILLFTEI